MILNVSTLVYRAKIQYLSRYRVKIETNILASYEFMHVRILILLSLGYTFGYHTVLMKFCIVRPTITVYM